MTTRAQQLLRAAAANLCRASAWLDPRHNSSDGAAEEALRLMREARLLTESVEITVGVSQAAREDSLQEGSR
jgi:hypothetical protein